MSTRSHIGIWNEDGSLDVIYCHWDGYPSYNGAVLLRHYQDPEKIRELIALGDISSLAESVKPVESEHTFEKRAAVSRLPLFVFQRFIRQIGTSFDL